MEPWKPKEINGINNGAMKPSMGRWNYQWIKEIINGSMKLFIYQYNPIIPLYWRGLKDCQKSRDIGAICMGQLMLYLNLCNL